MAKVERLYIRWTTLFPWSGIPTSRGSSDPPLPASKFYYILMAVSTGTSLLSLFSKSMQLTQKRPRRPFGKMY